MDTTALSIESFAQKLRAREFSAREVTAEYLATIHRSDATIGAFLSTREERALAEAEAVDAALARGESLPVTAGVPIALKDNMVVSGERTTAGSKILEFYDGTYDATVVRKLKESKAVVLGKTNLDEFAMGSSTENSAFHPTRNPHDTTRVSGGSSGGSAASVAGGMALAALGSDTGGSIRQPAAFCGVVGLKPTYGAVSRFGLIAMASSLDQIGPITRTVRDASLVFDAICGKDPFDATSVARAYSPSDKRGTLAAAKFTVGIPKEYFGIGLAPEVERAMETAMARLKSLGFTFKGISLPHTAHAVSVYYIVMPAEVSTNLARFDGIRYPGVPVVRENARNLRDLYVKTRGRGFGDEARRRILLGTFVLSAGYYDAYYAKAQKVRRLIAGDFTDAFKSVDVIFAPTTPTPAFRLGEKVSDPLSMYLSDVFTVPANLAGIPAISIPVKRYRSGTSPDEFPIGFQLMAPHFREADLFSIGERYESES